MALKMRRNRALLDFCSRSSGNGKGSAKIIPNRLTLQVRSGILQAILTTEQLRGSNINVASTYAADMPGGTYHEKHSWL